MNQQPNQEKFDAAREAQRQGFSDFRNGQATTDAPPDRAAASLGTLDAHGLAALRSILLTVIDDGDPLCAGAPWELYVSDRIDFDKANFQRLDFASAVEAEIVRRAAPATVAKGERR